MRKGFWNGLVAGGLLGATMAWFMSPQMKPGSARRIMGRSRGVGGRARRMLRQVSDGINDLMDR